MKYISNVARLGVRLGVVSAVVALGFATTGRGAVLFTTGEDFATWSGGGFVTAPLATSLDANNTNGLGNTAAAGVVGTPGSLSLTSSGTTYGYIYSPGEQGNAAFLTELQSNSTLLIDYVPPAASGGYFQLGVVFNYDGHFDQIFPTSTTDNGGYTTATYTINVVPENYTYFQLGVIFNSSYAGTPFTIDNVRTPTALPEPAAAGIGSIAGLLALARRRR